MTSSVFGVSAAWASMPRARRAAIAVAPSWAGAITWTRRAATIVAAMRACANSAAPRAWTARDDVDGEVLADPLERVTRMLAGAWR